MDITCISDLHGHYPQLEGGDLLIVAGDLTRADTVNEHLNFCDWIEAQDYKIIIVIAGNHDNVLEKDACLGIGDYDGRKTEYLCDSSTEFEGLKIWGSPWTLRFPGENPNCLAFTCETEEELAEKWALIPDDTDILVTHSPAFWYGDKTIEGKPVGSPTLRKRLREISLKEQRIKLHIFGHIHEAYGADYGDATVKHRINASHVNERYEPVNRPVRIEL